MKIKATEKIVTLKGEPYKNGDEELTLGVVLAESLANDTTGGKMKIFSLAQKFFNNDEVELDAADMVMVKKAVEQCKSYNNIILGQALTLLEGYAA